MVLPDSTRLQLYLRPVSLHGEPDPETRMCEHLTERWTIFCEWNEFKEMKKYAEQYRVAHLVAEYSLMTWNCKFCCRKNLYWSESQCQWKVVLHQMGHPVYSHNLSNNETVAIVRPMQLKQLSTFLASHFPFSVAPKRLQAPTLTSKWLDWLKCLKEDARTWLWKDPTKTAL